MHIGQAIEIAPRFSHIDGEPLDEFNHAAGHVVDMHGEDIEVRLIDGTEMFFHMSRVRAR